MIRPDFLLTPTASSNRRPSRPRAGRLEVTRVDPEVWGTALVLADGNVRRLEVRSETEVVVTNHERRTAT